MYLGSVYEGQGDPELAVAAMANALQEAGLAVQPPSGECGLIRLEATYAGRWHQLLWRNSLQRVRCQVRQRGEQLRLQMDTLSFRWYAAYLGALQLLALSAIAIGGSAQEASDEPQKLATSLSLVLAGLALTVWVLYCLGGPHARHKTMIWNSVLGKVEGMGGRLEPRQGPIRDGLKLLGFALAFAAVGLWIVLPELANSARYSGPGVLWLLALIGLCALVMLSSVSLLMAHNDFNLRSYAIVPAVATISATIAFLGVTIIWLGAAANFPDIGKFHHRAEEFLGGEGIPDDLTPEQADQVDEMTARTVRQLQQLRLLSVFGIGATVLFLVIAGWLVSAAIRASLLSRPLLVRLRERRDMGIYRRAVRGGKSLILLRWIFATTFAGLSSVALLLVGLALLFMLQAIAPTWPLLAPRVPEFSAEMVAFALGRSPEDPLIWGLVRSAWIVYGVSMVSVWLTSVGELWHQRRQLRQKLRRHRSYPGSVPQTILDQLLLEGTSPTRVRIAELPLGTPKAAAHSFGLFCREHYIEISTESIDQLEAGELKALIAHELAHHLNGHCTRYALFRWLGRLCFLGDGCINAMFDSFGSEQAADDTAAQLLGNRKQLDLALQKVQSATKLHSRTGSNLDAAHTAAQFHRLPLATRCRYAWHLFLLQYFKAGDLHYWHPPLAERRARLGRSFGGQ